MKNTLMGGIRFVIYMRWCESQKGCLYEMGPLNWADLFFLIELTLPLYVVHEQ